MHGSYTIDRYDNYIYLNTAMLKKSEDHIRIEAQFTNLAVSLWYNYKSQCYGILTLTED